MSRGLSGRVAVAVAVAMLASAATPARADGDAMEFVRVVVPEDRLGDVPLAAGRFVPMPLGEFDRAIGAMLPAGAARRVQPLATDSRYDLAIDSRGRLTGTLAFQIDEASALLTPSMPLGAIQAERPVVRDGERAGEAVLFGTAGGGVSVRIPTPGRYSFDIAVPPLGSGVFHVPLVPALTTRLVIRVPSGSRPVVGRSPQGTALVTRSEGDGDAWWIDVGGSEEIDLAIVPVDAVQPRLRCWNRVAVRGRQIDVAVRIVPEGPWRAGPVVIRKDPDLELVRARLADGRTIDLEPAGGGTRCAIEVPPAIEGTTGAIDVTGVAEGAIDSAFPVPTVRPPTDRWAGGGTTVVVDPAFAIAALDVDESVVVAPAAGDRWPVATGAEPIPVGAATAHIEQQSSSARTSLTITRREPRLDTVRVTTLELSPGAVIGRAACDVRVGSGEAFVIVGRVAPEWFIDSVEAVEWPTAAAGADEEGGSRQPLPEPERAIDWRVIRSAAASELRIGLAEAATPTRSLGLRITGHRRGVPIGGEFLPADLDMVRFDGETAESTLVDYRVGPDAVVEFGGEPLGILPADGRFAPLVEAGSPRGRVAGGDRMGGGTARLVRRRPPLDAEVAVQVVARDSRITESLSFTCSPEAGAVDSVVVAVSEPLGDAVEWSLVDPADGALYARRLEAAGGSDTGATTAERESWLIELRPAVSGAVTFRATRTQPFNGPTAIPLAWVDGATEARGTLVVRGAGGARPGVVNRGLSERPPAMHDDRAAAVVTELTYGPPEDFAAGAGARSPVVVVPPDTADARAWVWREATTACCHDSGWIECESEFDIENRGRTDVSLTVPPGLRLDEVTIDGEPAPFDGVSESGGTTRVLLPTGRGRVRLHVRGIASRDPSVGAWRIDPITCTIDVPLLDRSLRLKLPADLDLFLPGRDADGGDDWIERLFDATLVRPSSSLEMDDSDAGFRLVDLPPTATPGAYVVRRRLVSSWSIVAAVALAAITAVVTRRRPLVAVTLVVTLALAALWTPTPFAAVARAAWWGGLVGLGCGMAGLRYATAGQAAVLLVALVANGAIAAEPDVAPYRVYVTGDEADGTALVPEPMFRRLSKATAGRESVRVRAARLVVTPSGPWRLELEVDADQGGVLVIDQSGADVRCRQPERTSEGVVIDVSPDARSSWAAISLAGLHRVVVELTPRPVRAGGVECVAVRMPAAASTTVELASAAEAGSDRWQCDRGDRAGDWRPVAEAGGACDVSRAAWVRLTRSVDVRHPLVAIPDKAESVNELWWGEDACVVNAAFDVDPGRSVVRSLVVRADPPLEPVADGAAGRLVPLGGGRYLVEVPDPTPGPFRVTATFAMSLDDPAGVFDVPRVWLDAVGSDVRVVRCSAAAGLDLTAELPPGFSLLRSRDGETTESAAAWRSEEVSAVVGRGEEPRDGRGPVAIDDRPRPRVSVRRRAVPPRLGQRLDVTFAADEIDLAFECQIDSRSGPFTGVAVDIPAEARLDRVAIVDEGNATGLVDVHVSRPTPSRLMLVTQRPRPGIYRLTVAAHVAGRPPARGAVPIARCITPDESPLALRWRSRGGIGVVVEPAAGMATERSDGHDLLTGEAAPTYSMDDIDDMSQADAGNDGSPRPPAPIDVPLGNTVEATVVQLSLDHAGRIWGLARFELAAADPVVRVRFPSGFRLFDVLVDGRELQASPAGSNAWDVRLHDVRWPRSLLVVFAGQATAAADAGGAMRLEPPWIEGLDCHDVFWRIDAPADVRVRVAEPGRVVPAAAWRGARAAIRSRIADMFTVAVEGSPESDRERLRAFAEARGSGGDPPLELEWERAVQGPVDAGRTRVYVLGGGADGLTIRTARRAASGIGGRSAATAVLLAALVMGGLVAGWRPNLWLHAITATWPWLVAAAGAVWAILLRPALPGLALVLVAMLVLSARFSRGESGLVRLQRRR